MADSALHEQGQAGASLRHKPFPHSVSTASAQIYTIRPEITSRPLINILELSDLNIYQLHLRVCSHRVFKILFFPHKKRPNIKQYC